MPRLKRQRVQRVEKAAKPAQIDDFSRREVLQMAYDTIAVNEKCEFFRGKSYMISEDLLLLVINEHLPGVEDDEEGADLG